MHCRLRLLLALLVLPVFALPARARAAANASAPIQSSAALIAKPTTEGSSPWLSETFMKS